MDLDELRRTDPARTLLLARLLAAVPLVGIGLQHLTGAAPLAPILESACLPWPELSATVAPLGQLLAGALLAVGFWARLAGLLGAVQMVVALYTQVVVDWTEEPPLLLPIVVLAASLAVLWRGAGPWSLDRAATSADGSAEVARA